MTESIDSTIAAPVEPVDTASVDPHDAVIAEALGVIDGALGRMTSRELVSSGEVADLLLDLRTALTAPSSTSA